MKSYPIDILAPGKDEGFREYTDRVHAFVVKRCPEALVHCEWAGAAPHAQEKHRHGDAQWRDMTPVVYCRTGVESPIVEVSLITLPYLQTPRVLIWHAKSFNDTAALWLLTHLTAAFHHLYIHPKLAKLLTPNTP